MDERLELYDWLHDTLAGNAVGVADRVFNHEVPGNFDTWPAIVYDDMSDEPRNGVGGKTLMESQLWQVKVIGKEKGIDYRSVKPVAHAVDALLKQKRAKFNGLSLTVQLYSRPPMPPEHIGQDWWIYVASLWRIHVGAA